MKKSETRGDFFQNLQDQNSVEECSFSGSGWDFGAIMQVALCPIGNVETILVTG